MQIQPIIQIQLRGTGVALELLFYCIYTLSMQVTLFQQTLEIRGEDCFVTVTPYLTKL